MNIFRKVCLFLLVIPVLTYSQGSNREVIYKDVSKPIKERVNDLLSRMTLEEKVLQISQLTLGYNNNTNNIAVPVEEIPNEIGSLVYYDDNGKLRNEVQKKAIEKSRLGIPIIFGYDVIHGYKTIYPIPLAQACSWNTELVKQAAAIAAQEARMSGVDWAFSPMVDVARDGRWGRVAEGYGEDSYTNAAFGVATIEGYQGTDMANEKNIAACLKHYVGYGASEGGRDYVFTEISRQTLWDTYMLPYEMGVEAGAATLMSCFNDISGTPGTANHYILTEILKERWKHDGFVVSDWGSIVQLMRQGAASDRKEATMRAFNAGVEMDMMNRCYNNYLPELIREGKISMYKLDDAVGRVLQLKFKLGLFENPYTSIIEDEERFLLPHSIQIAQQLAEESIVLLKNENKILPLTETSNLAVIGPMGKNQSDLLGSWQAHGNPSNVVSIYQGLEKEFKGKNLYFAQGCGFEGNDKKGFVEAIEVANKSDVILLCLGEKRSWSGENASRSTLSLPSIQEDLAIELSKTGKPIILILSSGRPLAISNIEPIGNGIIQFWQPGIAGGNSLAGILSGRLNPSGKLSITFPYATGQIPIYYNQRRSARPLQGKYQDIPSTPLYEFGHGLSYTTFDYGDMKISAQTVKKEDKLTVEIPVTNTGEKDGMETVHWFVSDPVSIISRPIKELKHFEKQFIRKGKTKIFRFEVNLLRDLGYIDANGTRFLESGEYYIIVKDKKIRIEVL